jgi:hypothetical protein
VLGRGRAAAVLVLHILRRGGAALRRQAHGGGRWMLLAHAAARLPRLGLRPELPDSSSPWAEATLSESQPEVNALATLPPAIFLRTVVRASEYRTNYAP